VQTTIDLAGIAVAASPSVSTLQSGFLIREGNGAYSAITMGSLFDPAANQGRSELVRYDSPTIAGFIASASIGEAGDYWGVLLRYAGEFSGVRIAGGIGYENITDRQTQVSPLGGPVDIETLARPEVTAWGGSLAVLHVPSGLFAQGHYLAAEYSCNTGDPNAAATTVPAAQVSQQWGQTTDCRKDANQWLVQAGIAKNFFGLGNTSLYGEYSKNNGWGAGDFGGRNFAGSATAGTTTVNGVTDTEGTMYGLGLVQAVDAAAATFYLSWRHFDYDITCTGGGADCSVAGVGAAKKLSTSDLDVVYGGAVFKF
jgi:hypothetical protein